MDKARFQRIEAIYHEVADLTGPAFEAALDRLCTDDADLRAEVLALIQAPPSRPITELIGAAAAASSSAPALNPGDRIDAYVVEALIGRGGMGEVYQARQHAPIERNVAIKVLRTAVASPLVIARFESERQALALMENDAIAKVYDAGTLSSGQPYFVMELVEGLPIDEYCRAQQLDVVERLKLVVRLCRGVAHAHQKGVLHRDLKPSNVLVKTTGSDEAQVKIIDFGIAKSALALTPESIHTQIGQVMGTPDYMSPEQADTLGANVDTRSDVYSLGVITYELLTGVTPLELAKRGAAGASALIRMIHDLEPELPSRRITQLDAGAFDVTLAETPARMSRILREDLDWIVMRAIEKDRDRRYPGANDLADDLERYLNHQPVEASPPNRVYRLRKFVRRHQAGSALAAGAVASMIVGLIVYAVALDRALTAEREASKQARIAEANAKFLTDLFVAADPARSRLADVTARELIDIGVERLQESLKEDPVTRAAIQTTIGRVLRQMGRYDEARAQMLEALEIYRQNQSGNELAMAHTMNSLSTLERRTGNLDRALELAEQSLALRLSVLDPEEEHVGRSYSLIGIALALQGRYDDAEPHMKRAAQIAETTVPGTPVHATSVHNYGVMLRFLGRLPEAARNVEQAARILEASDSQRPEVADYYNEAGAIYTSLGELDRADELIRQALALRETYYGARHPMTADSLTTLAELQIAREDWQEALAPAQQAVEIYRDRDSRSELRAYALEYLATAQAGLNRLDLAESLLDEAISFRREIQPAGHPNRLHGELAQARVLAMTGREDEANALMQDILAYREPILGSDHEEVVRLREEIAALQ
ncbi:MAG: serine/threonine-protein kinase [Pseudomonadales bacterium]